MESTKKLIVAADDFGLTLRVNEAIGLAHRNGIVTSASLLATGAAFDSAVEIAHHETTLDVGLHLNLTEGRPVADPATVPSISDSRGFLYNHPFQLATALFAGRIRRGDLEREIRAQIEKAVGSDVDITHIDGHKHVHVMPSVLQLVFKIAPEYGIRAIRSTREKTPRLVSMLLRNKQSWQKILKQYLFGRLISTAWLISRPKALGTFAVPKRFYGVTQTGFLDHSALADVVDDLDEGIHEVMCHPGYVDADLLKTPTRLRSERERELELLTGTGVRALLSRAGVTLVGYKALVENYGNRRPDPVLHRYSPL
jgi:hopanoid biosynthesis associated protein HpnK